MRKIDVRLDSGVQFVMLSDEKPKEVIQSIFDRFGKGNHEIKTKSGWKKAKEIKT